jgi:hypothetical protein
MDDTESELRTTHFWVKIAGSAVDRVQLLQYEHQSIWVSNRQILCKVKKHHEYKEEAWGV